MNVLLTCAGRRNYLVHYFSEALGGNGKVFAADTSADAPAMAEADRAFVVPPVNASGYPSALLAICKAHDVRLLVPLNDLELPVLAAQRRIFLDNGIIPVVSTPEVIDTCFDKLKTTQFIAGLGLSGPVTTANLLETDALLKTGALRFPIVVKPRWGSASIGIEFPEDREELDLAFTLVRKRVMRTFLAGVSANDPDGYILIQEKLGGQEYGLDVVNDLNGRHVATFIKRKLAMRAGETDRAETVDQPALRDLGARIGTALGHVGNLDCDVFLTPDGPRVLEMNPRFGGGYPFSHEAGANLPAVLLAWAANRTPDPTWLRMMPGVRSAKCDRLVITART